MTGERETLERVTTPRGDLVLRRVDGELEVISNGVFLMDTRDGRSERLLVRAALHMHPAAGRLLIGGLGVGFSLLEAVAVPGLSRIVVTEIEPAVVDWHATHLRDRTGDALADPRVAVVVADVRDELAGNPGAYDVVCLDVDNGPDWTVTGSNAGLYDDAGLALCVRALAPRGVLAVWSAGPAPQYHDLFRAHLDDVHVEAIESRVERAAPDVVFLGRAG